MKSLVLYDSNFGNTKAIAEAIAAELGDDTKAVVVASFNKSELHGIELLVVGSPIMGWRPSERMISFLLSLNRDELKGVKAATFDTRVKLFIHGDAMTKIAQALEGAGAEIIVKSSPFYVKGREGPLFEGEIEKARDWAKQIKAKA